jgi:hypothetical protein
VTPLTVCTTILATRTTRRRSGWCTRSRTPGSSCSRTPTLSRSCGAAGRRPSTVAAAGGRGGGFTTRSGASTAATSRPAPGPGTAPYIQVSRENKIYIEENPGTIRNMEKTLRKNILSVASWKTLKKRTGSGTGSGSVTHWSGSGDPDPYLNVTDPEFGNCDYLNPSQYELVVAVLRQR